MPFNVKAREFWNQEAVDGELRRVFDICHGCRRCFTLCPSFESLFKAIDTKGEEVDALDSEDCREIINLCYQCKLCFNHCPYTPPHRWEVDFPRLMLRGKLVKAKYQGIPLRDRILGNTDRLGAIGCRTVPASNWGNRLPAFRIMLEGTLGIHRDRNLPTFHRQTFHKWFLRHAARSTQSHKTTPGKVALFYTCTVNYNNPTIGKSTVKVLERNGVGVIVPDQKCCGMPFLDSGDLESALENIEFNLKRLEEVIDEGYDIVTPGPTCSLMIKQEYPALVKSERAEKVSAHCYDICEYMMKLHADGKLDTGFIAGAGRVAYQVPCHLRAQNIGYKSRDLMQLLPNTQVKLIEQCSAHDGAWGTKKEFYQISIKWAGKLFKQVQESEADVVASDCPLSSLQIAKGTQRRPLHPMEIVARAYGLDGE